MVICFSAGFSYSVLMWPRFAVHQDSLQGPRLDPRALKRAFTNRGNPLGLRMSLSGSGVSICNFKMRLSSSRVSLYCSRIVSRNPG